MVKLKTQGKKLLLTRMSNEVKPSYHYRWKPGVSSCGLKVSCKQAVLSRWRRINWQINIGQVLTVINIYSWSRQHSGNIALDPSISRACIDGMVEFEKLLSSRACAREWIGTWMSEIQILANVARLCETAVMLNNARNCQFLVCYDKSFKLHLTPT